KVSAYFFLFVCTILEVNIYDIQLSHLPHIGIMCGLLAATSFTMFLFVSGRVANHVPPLRKSMVMSLGAFIVILIVYPPTYFISGSEHVSFWLLGIMLGLFGAVLPP